MKRVGLILLSLLLAACGRDAIVDGPGRQSPLRSLGQGCETGEIDGPGMSYLEEEGAWVQVTRLDLGSVKGTSYAGSFTVTGGDPAPRRSLPAALDRLELETSTAEDVAAALKTRANVWAHVGGRQGGPTEVHYAVAIDDLGFAFLGECQRRLLTTPFGARFRTVDPRAQAQTLVTATRAQLVQLLEGPPRTRSPQPTVLDVASGNLTGLTTIHFSLRTIEPSWTSDDVICTKVARGWGECLNLALTEINSGVLAYVDPAAPVVEIWLLNEQADLSHPLARLARLDLRSLGTVSTAEDLSFQLNPDRSASGVGSHTEPADGSVLDPRLT